MRILDQSNDLEKYLSEVNNKTIHIISAFASSTEKTVQSLISNGNNLNIVLGTINCFTSAAFIQFCADQKVNIHVDFRYDDSTHWKIYLIAPSTVIVGSANFTGKGIGLSRDTCVLIEDSTLYDQYIGRYEALIELDEVIPPDDTSNFKKHFTKYKTKHDLMQRNMARAQSYKTPSEWLANEANESIPLLVWEHEITEEELEAANALLDAEGLPYDEDKTEYFTYDKTHRHSYYEGDIVLTIGSNGEDASFNMFNKILEDNGTLYAYCWTDMSRQRPFKLTRPLKKALGKNTAQWLKDDTHLLLREDISSLAKLS
ncbi:phospholipase D family protein [Endozoicomonas ascidiicola]|uniref:phospholipase D family protein n=1 Tax=Endozoicomonas ascidiicola TaxID=1698521 RepID=UPI00082FBDB7|nr:phospholipase D family protein [Endozoicomonas ascidiicola]